MKRFEAQSDEIQQNRDVVEAELPSQTLESVVVPSSVDSREKQLLMPRRRGFVLPSRKQLLSWLPFWVVILLGAVLRFWGLGDKPLHHDESLHAYFSLQLLHNNIQNWSSCFSPQNACYRYDPLLHGPFQFHAIAFVYQISQWLNAPDHGINTTTVRIAAALLGTVIVGLPYFLKDRLGTIGAWLACFLLAVSPSLVYYSRFAREDIYMACFTLLLVVATARYLRSRSAKWLILAAVAFALSYATKEATFLTIAIFGSFLGALIVWELGARWTITWKAAPRNEFIAAYRPRTWASMALLAYIFVMGIVAKVFFGWLKALSIYITKPQNTVAANAYVQVLKDNTMLVIPWIGILLGIFVLSILFREIQGKLPVEGRRGIAKWIDPSKQPLLNTIVTMPWTSWFFALLCAWAVFLVLFTALFTNIRGGIEDGIWQGLYYWLQQQQVARGSQPWYYYLLLIPLYEQIGLVFGLVGVVRSLLQPTRFRLFLACWFVGNLFIYSWAAEKMPWLLIHITMPMMLLAAIGLEPVVSQIYNFVRGRIASGSEQKDKVSLSSTGRGRLRPFGAMVTGIIALLLLVLTLQNMFQVNYVHAADAPHEMLIYVQTTTDANTIMDRIAAVDQKLYGGRHQIKIGVTQDAVWPFIWYLHDYPNICLDFPSGCSNRGVDRDVVIADGTVFPDMRLQYGKTYALQAYSMRSWWDEGYKPPPCIPSPKSICSNDPLSTGIGLGLWLSYGDNPPPNAAFSPGLAIEHIWQWWWQRRAIGSTQGAYGMGLLIRKDINIAP